MRCGLPYLALCENYLEHNTSLVSWACLTIIYRGKKKIIVACDSRLRGALDTAADPRTAQCSFTSVKLFIALSETEY